LLFSHRIHENSATVAAKRARRLGRGQAMPSRRRSDSEPRRDPIKEAIARRAYELFLARGGEHGHDLDDWLQAERELAEAGRSSREPADRS